MKKIIKQVRKIRQAKAFTLIEMLLVLLIVSFLVLLFVPTMANREHDIETSGEEAVTKVVESQAEMYKLTHADEPTLDSLLSSGYINTKQMAHYIQYYEKNPIQTPPYR